MSAITKFCEDNNIDLVGAYEDDGFSATTARRPAFQRLINDAMNKPEWDLILIYDLSRFARNYCDAVTYETKLGDLGIEIVSITQTFESSNEGELLKGIIHLINHYYSKNNAKHTHSGMLEKARSAQHCGGTPCLGFDVDKDLKLVINEYEASIVRYIFDMYEKGYSYAEMAKILNEEGYFTKNGTKFTKNSFEHLLRQKKYIGTYTWNKASAKQSTGARNSHKFKNSDAIVNIENGCPSIISEEQFNRVQQMLETRGSTAKGVKSKNHYMLGGIKKLKCEKCGSFLIGSIVNTHGKRYMSYYCPNHKGKDRTCSLKPILGDPLNEIVAEMLAEKLCYGNTDNKVEGYINNSDDYRRLQEQIRGKDKAISNLIKVIEGGKGNDTIEARLRGLSSEREALALKANVYENENGVKSKRVTEYKEEVKDYLIKSRTPRVRDYLERAIDYISADDDSVTIVLND